MSSLQHRPAIRFTQTEDDETIGTVRQFSERLDLPTSQVLPCLQDHDDSSIILQAGRGPDQLLILDSGGVEVLQQCAGASSSVV